MGAWLFVFGFVVWNLDNIFCTALTRQKVAIGWPSAFLLEGAFQ
jgi:dihydroceramidase